MHCKVELIITVHTLVHPSFVKEVVQCSLASRRRLGS